MGQYAGMLAGIGAIIDAIVNKQWGSIREAYNNAKNSVATQVDDFIAQTTNYTDWQAKYGKMNADELYAELETIDEENKKLKDENKVYSYLTGQKLTLDNVGDFVTKDLGADVSNSSSDSSKDYEPMTKLEKLKKLASLIDKEYESMLALQNNRYTEYFKKMGDNLAEQKKAVLEEIVLLSAELEKLTPGTEKYDKKYSDLNERQADLIDIEKKIANLDDEELEDKMKNLQTIESTIAA